MYLCIYCVLNRTMGFSPIVPQYIPLPSQIRPEKLFRLVSQAEDDKTVKIIEVQLPSDVIKHGWLEHQNQKWRFKHHIVISSMGDLQDPKMEVRKRTIFLAIFWGYIPLHSP